MRIVKACLASFEAKVTLLHCPEESWCSLIIWLNISTGTSKTIKTWVSQKKKVYSPFILVASRVLLEVGCFPTVAHMAIYIQSVVEKRLRNCRRRLMTILTRTKNASQVSSLFLTK